MGFSKLQVVVVSILQLHSINPVFVQLILAKVLLILEFKFGNPVSQILADGF